MKRVLCGVFALIGLGAGAEEAWEPHLLVIGGGASPLNNQVSLEKNVEFFWRLKKGWGIGEVPEKLFFSDGENPGRDVQLYDPDKAVPEVARAMSLIFAGNEDVYYRYRSHGLAGAEETGAEGIGRYFENQKLGRGDRLFVYYTGHGGRGSKATPENTSLNLWRRRDLRMVDFCSMLDKVDPEVPVTLLMVQCFAGGFGNVLFKEGDPKKGLTDHARCGFFATVSTREAAGCTPSVDEADYREYSSYFLAALGGETRGGDPVKGWDLDADGKVSFVEAHAYAVVDSVTVDIPVRTGGIFLRAYSKLPDGKDGSDDLLGTESYDALMKVAGTCDRVILEKLSARMGLTGDRRMEEVRAVAEAIEKKRKVADGERRAAKKEIESVRTGLKREVAIRWPELANGWDPEAGKVMEDEGEAVMRFLNGNAEFGKLREARKKWQAAEEAFFEFDEEWALRARFKRTADNVAREANLPKVAGEEIVSRFREIERLEGGALRAE